MIRLTLAEGFEAQRTFWRSPPAAVFVVILPLLFLSVLGSMEPRGWPAGGPRFADVLVPGIVVMSLLSASFSNLAASLCLLRDTGVLKRLRGTPLPPAVFLCGRALSCLVTVAVQTLLVAAIGAATLGASLPGVERWPAVALVLVLGTTCFAACAAAFTALIPHFEVAPAMVNGLALILLLLSGAWNPELGLPGPLDTVLHGLPLGALLDGLRDAWAGTAQSAFPALAVLAGWTLGALALARAVFRWEPHARTR